MVRLIDISDSQEYRKQFIDYGISQNASYSKSFPKTYDDESALLDEGKNFFFKHGGKLKAFIAIHNNRVVGRIGAMINPLIQYQNETPGLIGLFEVNDDFEIARLLLSISIQWFRDENIKMILGPMNFSIWHNYRYLDDCSESIPFIGEPQNPQYYPEFFKRFGFRISLQWQSRMLNIDGIKAVMNRFMGHAETFDALSYSLVKITDDNVMDTLRIAHTLVMDTYKHFDLFTQLSLEEFVTTYSYLPQFLDRDLSYLVKDDTDEYIAFIFVLKDLSSLLTGNKLTTGINFKPELPSDKRKCRIANLYQGGVKISALREAWEKGKKEFNNPLSISRAVLYKIFGTILETRNYNHVIFPLMREGAPNKNYSNGLYVQERNYHLYELKIG